MRSFDCGHSSTKSFASREPAGRKSLVFIFSQNFSMTPSALIHDSSKVDRTNVAVRGDHGQAPADAKVSFVFFRFTWSAAFGVISPARPMRKLRVGLGLSF